MKALKTKKREGVLQKTTLELLKQFKDKQEIEDWPKERIFNKATANSLSLKVIRFYKKLGV